jgi:hypothetical protein
MLFKKTVTVYYENHMEHTNTLCGQNLEFTIKQVVHTRIPAIMVKRLILFSIYTYVTELVHLTVYFLFLLQVSVNEDNFGFYSASFLLSW